VAFGSLKQITGQIRAFNKQLEHIKKDQKVNVVMGLAETQSKVKEVKPEHDLLRLDQDFRALVVVPPMQDFFDQDPFLTKIDQIKQLPLHNPIFQQPPLPPPPQLGLLRERLQVESVYTTKAHFGLMQARDAQQEQPMTARQRELNDNVVSKWYHTTN
jgi:hypothetical protein